MTQTVKGRCNEPIGIIDTGSNSVRLVVYEGGQRMPLPLFNEKAVCALGQGLEKTGHLHPEGVALAFAAMARFVRLARFMGVDRLDVLATAAVRDAADGAPFVAELTRQCGVPVRVLHGAEEAELAGLGVLCATPAAHGVVADLGGGSLELVQVAGGAPGRSVTLPLGVLRLADAVEGDTPAVALIDRHLDALDWLKAGQGEALYAVGGAWRAIAHLCIHHTHYPLHILDNFTVSAAEGKTLLPIIGALGRKALAKAPGVSKKRLPCLPLAVGVLMRLLEIVQPARLVFSIHGMREGQFFKTLPPEVRREDPLIAACHHLLRCAERFPEHGDELMAWMVPLFPDEREPERRLRYAACLLGDAFWNEHPDYRAEQAFLKVLRAPFMGLEHRERVALALAVYHRYKGASGAAIIQPVLPLLDDATRRRTLCVGLALRLAHTLTGGTSGLLQQSRLFLEDRCLTLILPGDEPAFAPGFCERRLEKLAQAMGCRAVVVRS
ncbi:MAG: exopolyphosphatase / guanosine-5'-triphosphate 3'-diphosphate pyrophosphatase [Rhodospirillaceae bacterium]|nr:MAG: exopolyphosphatase / guanosine-5'-triphosphate 3'-diphosphate pyrophosphatase [Rhodospirillaceae bacterium]